MSPVIERNIMCPITEHDILRTAKTLAGMQPPPETVDAALSRAWDDSTISQDSTQPTVRPDAHVPTELADGVSRETHPILQPPTWRHVPRRFVTMFQSKTVRWSAVAAIAAAVVLAVGLWPGKSGRGSGSGIAWADVIQHISQARTAVFEMTLHGEGIPQQSFQVMRLEPGRQRTIFPGGEVVQVSDAGINKVLMLNTKDKKATILERDEAGTGGIQQNSFEAMKSLYGSAEEVLGEREVNGQIATGYRVRKDSIDWIIWADPQTGLPIRVEASGGPLFGGGKLVMSGFKFNGELDESLFSLEPPQGYSINVKQVRASRSTEQDLVGTLRTYADIMGGEFPRSFDMVAITKRLQESGKKNLGKEWLERTMNGLMFVQRLPKDSDWHYAGAEVKLGQTELPLCWWKPGGSQVYRVVFGDLRVRDLDKAEVDRLTTEHSESNPGG